MSKRHSGRDRFVPWNNRLQYLTARSQNAALSSHQILLKGRFAGGKSLFRRDLKSHFGCVNAIEFSNDGLRIISGGDDRRVLVWNVERAVSDTGAPVVMKGEHNSNIFCLAINKSNTRIYSGGNDEQVVVHDIESGQTVDVFQHEEAVYGLSDDPNNEYIFASACDDGRVLVYDTREPPTSDPFELASYTSSMHAVMYNPAEPRLLATANAKEGLALWDIRRPKECLMRYGGRYLQQSCMSVRINNRGTHLVALRRRLPPVLYEIGSSDPLCDFDHDGYYNSCTMKSCTFAGPNDEYILSGSDDFNLYMWKVPGDLSQRVYVKEAHMILRGHRSIVNQVRYDYHSGIIISSGVEKIIKVWSPFALRNGCGDMEKAGSDRFTERPVFTHEEYINLVLRSGLGMNHDYSSQSMEEDPRMMAFFDSLVQREHEFSSSDEDLSSNEVELYDSILQVTRPPAVERQTRDDAGLRNAVGSEDQSRSSDTSDSEFSPFAIAFASVLAAQETDASQVLEAHEQSERNRLEVEDDIADPILRYQRLYGPRGKLQTRKSISDIIAHNRKEMMRASKQRYRHQQDKSPTLTSLDSDSDIEPVSVSIRSSADVGHVLNKRSAERQRAAYRLKRLQALRTRLAISDTSSSSSSSSDEDSTPAKKRPRVQSHLTSADSSDKTDPECGTTKQAECKQDKHKVCVNLLDLSSSLTHSTSLRPMAKGKSDFEDKAGPCLQQKDTSGSQGIHLTSVSHSELATSTSGESAPCTSAHYSTNHHKKNRDTVTSGESASCRLGHCSSNHHRTHTDLVASTSGESAPCTSAHHSSNHHKQNRVSVRKGDGPGHRRRDKDSTSDGPGHRRRDKDSTSDGPGHRRRDKDSTKDGPGHRRRDKETTGDGHSYSRRDKEATGDGHSYRWRDKDTTGDGHSYRRRDKDTTSDGHSYRQRDKETTGDGHNYRQRDKETTGDGHSYRRRDKDTTGDGHSYSRRDKDTTDSEDSQGRSRDSSPSGKRKKSSKSHHQRKKDSLNLSSPGKMISSKGTEKLRKIASKNTSVNRDTTSSSSDSEGNQSTGGAARQRHSASSSSGEGVSTRKTTNPQHNKKNSLSHSSDNSGLDNNDDDLLKKDSFSGNIIVAKAFTESLERNDLTLGQNHGAATEEPLAGSCGCSALGEGSLSAASAPSPQAENGRHSSEENPEPVWTEFKKFKKTLMKASRRHYRQQSSKRGHHVESSDDDD